MNHEVIIEKLAYGGEGIGKIGGKVCFVRNALPGETVLIGHLRDKKKFCRAEAKQIITPSPQRQTPPCIYYGKCGGCQYQHMDYREELRWKEIQVRDQLVRNLNLSAELISPIVRSPQEYHYRSSITVHNMRTGKLGFVSVDNETLVPVEECLLAEPALQSVLKTGFNFSKEMETLTYRTDKSGKVHCGSKDDFFEIQIGDEVLLTHTKCFFQNNLPVTAAIADNVKKRLGQINPSAFADLYAGVGTFTVLCASRIPKIICIEENVYGIRALDQNLKARSLQAAVLEGQVEAIFPEWIRTCSSDNLFLFLDPPRAGLDQKLSEFLAAAPPKIKHISYLSCHLGSLIRDLKILLKNGKWHIDGAIPFDMFPRTKHIEVLVHLSSN